MKPASGKQIIEIAKTYVGCHYLWGGYGATPNKSDGSPARPGMVKLIADPKRLDPTITDPKKALGVFAAWSEVAGYAVCGGSYSTVPGGRWTAPGAWDLTNYLDRLKAKPVEDWDPYYDVFTPRRVYGKGTTGEIYWGEDCRDVRHFDCVGFVNYCMWKLTGTPWQLDIKAWVATPNPPGGKVYDLKRAKPASLEDGDIVVLIAGHEHIGIVAEDGTIYQAEETKAGVTARGKFDLNAPGSWTHLVRLPN